VSGIEIQIEGLTKFYGRKRPGIIDCTTVVSQGKITAIVGKNGSGKTTVLKIILGLCSPTSGWCRVNGKRYNPLLRGLPGFGFLPEQVTLPNSISIRDLILHLGMARGLKPGHCLATLKELSHYFELDIGTRLKSSNLSHGMAQKTGIIQALIHDPDCIVLDEPTNALDPIAKKKLFQKLSELRDRGKTILISSHHLDEIERLADEIIVFHDNICIGKYAANEILSGRGRVKVVFTEGLTPEQCTYIKNTMPVQQIDHHCCYLAKGVDEDANQWIVALTQLGVKIESIDTVSLSLETAFLDIISGTGERAI
jgi:ABC-2 type transport system ATP-binding protein